MGFFPASATAQSGSRVETSRAETQPIDRTDNKTEPVGKSRENTALRHSSQFQCQKWKKNKKNKRAAEEPAVKVSGKRVEETRQEKLESNELCK